MKPSGKQLHPSKAQEEHSCKASADLYVWCQGRCIFRYFKLPSLLHPGVRVSFPLPLMPCSIASLVFFTGQRWLASGFPEPCSIGVGWRTAVLQQHWVQKYFFWWSCNVYSRAEWTTALYMAGHTLVSVGENKVLYGRLQTYVIALKIRGWCMCSTFSRSTPVQEVTQA